MTIQTGSNNYAVAVGTAPQNVQIPHFDVRAPATTDINYPVGKRWINSVANNEYSLTSISASQGALSATWTLLGAGAGDLNTLTGGTGGAISPSAGNITLAGTTNEITTTGSGSTITFSVPSTFVAPGSITATSGAITATNGNLVLGTAGNKIVSTSVATTTTAGANSFGSVTLASGTATVATSAVTANSLIVTWRQAVGASTALGDITIGTITGGTNFVVYAATVGTPGTPLATDASVVGWMIIN